MHHLPESTCSIFSGEGARARLEQLGLDPEVLAEIVRRGEMARAEATAHDPVTAAGQNAYQHRVRAKRDLLTIRRWTQKVDRGLECTVSPGKERQLITRGGFTGVGLENADPQPLRKFGSVAGEAFDANGVLFAPEWFRQRPANDSAMPMETWVLLAERKGDLVFAELSLPAEITDSEFVWLERILLPTTNMADPEPPRAFGDDEDGGGQEQDIEIVRKR